MVEESDFKFRMQEKLLNKIQERGNPTEEVGLIVFHEGNEKDTTEKYLSKYTHHFEKDNIDKDAYICKIEKGKIIPMLRKLEDNIYLVEIEDTL